MKAQSSQPLRRVLVQNPAELGRRATNIILSELKRKPDLLLCASAGGTPTRAYHGLAVQHHRHPSLFRKLRVLQIDEWAGLPHGDPGSCELDLRSKLLEPLGIDPGRRITFATDAADPQLECARVNRWLAAHGPIDLCILGLGTNGHVAMNEPAPEIIPQAHVTKLARSSLRHPLLHHCQRKPRFGMTIGMGDILSSRKILLLVSGSHKRACLARLLQPRVTTRFPASLLWLHPAVTVLYDRAAATDLPPLRGADIPVRLIPSQPRP